jgi:ATP-dependent Lon protease
LGDPASALLEVLDSKQNHQFLDHYLDIRFDLSNVLFLCTANQKENIPSALLDRMEIISLSGYIDEEKHHIAKKHLWPKQLKKVGLHPSKIKISDAAINKMIHYYAPESGVRKLDQLFSKIIRKSALSLIKDKNKKIHITHQKIPDYLGKIPFQNESLLKGVGVAKGVAWTALGGVILNIEAAIIHSQSRDFILTGQLGNVMKESAQIAYSFIAANLKHYHCFKNTMDKMSIHLHVPKGAIPKDGPSAGITMACALLSLISKKKIPLYTAMTGELSLTGHVLSVGGLREKIMAAKREKIHQLLLPESVKNNYDELPESLKKGIIIHFITHFDDVYRLLFSPKKTKKDNTIKNKQRIKI